MESMLSTRRCLAVMALVAVGFVLSSAFSSPRSNNVATGLRSIRSRGPSVMQRMGSVRAANRRPIEAMAPLDLRRAAPGKCVSVNERASVCGNLVVLRPSLAVNAEPEKTGSTDTTIDADKLISDISSKWEGVENKGQVAVYAGGTFLALVAANALVTTIDAIPVLPYFMKLVGTGYTTWFAYRYLFFDESRKELVEDLEVIKKKITGADM